MNISDDGSVVECVDPADFPHILEFLSSSLQDICHVTIIQRKTKIRAYNLLDIYI